MIEWLNYYSSKKPIFSRGILRDIGIHLNSDEFCVDCRNIRIKNGATTKRKWYQKVALWMWNDDVIYKMVVWDKIYANISGNFYCIDVTADPVTYTLLKSWIGVKANFVRYGRYIVICNGTTDTRVYDTEYDVNDTTKESPLPNTYIQLEYLESKSTWPYLNLWSITTNKPWIYAKIKTVEWTGDNYLFWLYAGASNYVWVIGNTQKESIKYQYKTKTKNSVSLEYNWDTKYTLKTTCNVLTLKSWENSETITTDDDAASITGNMYVFARDTSSISYGMRLYEMKIYKDTDIEMNLIPAKKKADWTIWLYDLVNDQFYTNVWTGEFVAWAEINYKDWAWRKCTLPDSAKIAFWAVFQDNIWLVWADEKSNTIYKSRAWNREKPRQVLDFIGDWSDDLTKKSNILWVASLRWTFYIFTEDSIDAITTESVTSVWWVYTVYSTPIAWENQLANYRAVVIADDSVFFWTKGNRLKTLNYKQWFTEISVGDITVWTPIQKFLDTLDPDQSQCFWYHNKEEYTVHFHLRQHAEPFNNIVLVYEIANDNLLIDNNKYFSDVVKFDWKYYAGSGINDEIYQDETWNNDCGTEISWYRDMTNIYISNPNYRKEFRELDIVWEKDSLGDIQVDISVDWKNVLTTMIEWQQWYPIWFASTATATEMTAWEAVEVWTTTFEKVVSAGNLRAKGKWIQVRFSGKWYWKSVLSNMTIWYRPMTDHEMTDRLKPFNWDNVY